MPSIKVVISGPERIVGSMPGEADILMKGYLHTDEMLRSVLQHDVGLRTDRLLSHVFVLEVPTYHKLLMITDAAINISPQIPEKAAITQNAVELARKLGVIQPKVAVLSSVETINPSIPSTVHAACLSKMAERGQIKGAIVDGPLAFDNAISAEAAPMPSALPISDCVHFRKRASMIRKAFARGTLVYISLTSVRA